MNIIDILTLFFGGWFIMSLCWLARLGADKNNKVKQDMPTSIVILYLLVIFGYIFFKYVLKSDLISKDIAMFAISVVGSIWTLMLLIDFYKNRAK